MALVIHLRKDGRVIINGAVLENVSGRAISLAVKNEASILRDDDVLQPEDAVTPASRIYFALQCAYVFRESRARHMAQLEEFLEGYVQAAPSALPLATAVRAAVEAGNLYEALKKARELFRHERNVMAGSGEVRQID
ncbi:MAG: flagellar biosynthesis repressor FlbT [Rhodospirillales bacterium]|nr:flagellar biosynthesis repressor FlbT [Rhodospirillales bacterium]